MDLSRFDGIEIRVRGDGRRFIANLQPAPGLVKQDDVWQSYVITRGGPQWENIMVRNNRLITKGSPQWENIIKPGAALNRRMLQCLIRVGCCTVQCVVSKRSI